MQLLEIDNSFTLSDLRDRIGNKNLPDLLAVNGLSWRPDIGKQITEKFSSITSSISDIDWQRKSTILSNLAGDSDIFENAALSGNAAWKVLSEFGVFPGTLKVPSTIKLPDGADIWGNGVPVSKRIYDKVINSINKYPYEVDPSIFNEYNSDVNHSAGDRITSTVNTNFFDSFKIPWGEIVLYSSFGDIINLPVFPETVDDGVEAVYATMPDLMYQYEPWYIYNSSGPRSCTYEFHMHRDMWTGNHADGKCNELIRMCEAQCFANYQGASVQTPTVSLYVSGKELIHGIMTSVKTSWAGPILNDGWYGEVTMTLSIVEVSKSALSYDVMKAKPLIG